MTFAVASQTLAGVSDPTVKPVFVAGHSRQLDLILNKSYTAITTGFNEQTLDTSGYTSLHIVVEVTGSSGTSPTLQADLIEVLPNSDRLDYYNSGTHTASFTYNITPAQGGSLSFVPAQFSLNYAVGGTTPSFNFNVFIWGQA